MDTSRLGDKPASVLTKSVIDQPGMRGAQRLRDLGMPFGPHDRRSLSRCPHLTRAMVDKPLGARSRPGFARRDHTTVTGSADSCVLLASITGASAPGS
jgi:hypothetical protein